MSSNVIDALMIDWPRRNGQPSKFPSVGFVVVQIELIGSTGVGSLVCVVCGAVGVRSCSGRTKGKCGRKRMSWQH